MPARKLQRMGKPRTDDQGNPRLFTSKMKQGCWEAAPPIPGRDPARWRYDAVGNPVCHKLRGCMGCACHEYDHIVPFSKGGQTVPANCQILQTRVNRLKGALDPSIPEVRSYSCISQLTTQGMDMIEVMVYGSIARTNGPVCHVQSLLERIGDPNLSKSGNLNKARLPSCSSFFGKGYPFVANRDKDLPSP